MPLFSHLLCFLSQYGNGSFRFSAFGVEGRASAIRWGVPLLHVWVSVVALLERAASSCSSSDINTVQIELLDKAAALYFGSEATEEGGGNEGNLIYSLAQVEGYKYGDMQKGIVSPAISINQSEALRIGAICHEVASITQLRMICN